MYPNKFGFTGIAAFFIVLLCMPLGHAGMILMDHCFAGGLLNLMTFLLGAAGFLIWSVWLFIRLVKIRSMGRAIRYALPTVIIFWTFIEVMGRIGLFEEIWIKPSEYKIEMFIMLTVFMVFVILAVLFRKKNHSVSLQKNRE